MKEHSEASREASSHGDLDVTASPGWLSPAATEVLRLQHAAGNRAVARLVRRRIQRRTAEPQRSDKTKTFTYSLKLYTVDADSYEQALELAGTLNAYSGTVFDVQTQQDYTVTFHVGVYAPPEPDILENAFGIDLHYAAGRKRLRPGRYREAAERWWLRFLRDPANTGNLFLGDHAPSEETKAYLREVAVAAGDSERNAVKAEFQRRLAAARQQSSANAVEGAKQWYRTEMDKLRKNDAERAVAAALDTPKEGQRGVTLGGSVVRMRPGGGSPQYKASIRLHEIMHLLGLSVDHTDVRPSLMSYPYLQQHQSETVLPQPDDLDQLVNVDNPPSSTSVD